MLFLHLGEASSDAIQMSDKLVDGSLFFGEVTGDDEGLGYEVTDPALVLLFAFLIGLDDTISLRLPAVGGDQVAIVLHSLGPAIHQVLIDIVGVNERLVGVVCEQTLGKLRDDLPGMTADRQSFEHRGARFPPHRKVGIHVCDKGDEIVVLVNCGFDSRFLHREVEIAKSVFLEKIVP